MTPEAGRPDAGTPDEVALARACAAGDRTARATLKERFAQRIEAPLAKALPSREARQAAAIELLERLCEGSPARINSYDGERPLGTWLRVEASREALRRLARGLASRPSLEARTAHHLGVSEDAAAARLAGLAPRDRNLLRYHWVEGLAHDAVARMYDVPATEVEAWLGEALQRLAAAE